MRFLICIICGGFSSFAQIQNICAEWEKDNCLRNASFAYSIRDAKTSAVLSEYESDRNLVPASTLKILTTAAALSVLGENYRYATTVGYTGQVISGVLKGDLVIKGSGDPSLHSAYFPRKIPVTDEWAAAIKQLGITEISGAIVGDASAVEQHINGSWLWEDVSNYFGAAPCGLNYNDNRFRIYLNSGKAGTTTTVTECSPRYLQQQYTFTNEVIAGGKEDLAFVYGDPLSFSKRITGSIPTEKTKFEIEAALPDPALLCAEQLYLSLQKSGIRCDPKKIISKYKSEKTNTVQLITTTYSPPLKELVYFTNQHSDNLYCEAILRSVGKNDAKNGLQTIKKFWHKNGVDSNSVLMTDGCGLARANSVNTDALARALCFIYSQPEVYKAFYGSLPAAGREGSMSSIGKTTPIEGNLRAKTGYMLRVRSYAGYTRTRSGKDVAFAVIFNNYTCSAKEARLRMNKFMTALYEL